MRRLPTIQIVLYALYVATTGAIACGGERSPVAPIDGVPAQTGPSLSVSYDNGWDGWLDNTSSPDGSLITCPTYISGIGPVLYQGRWWSSQNGPYVTTTRTLASSQYSRADRLPAVFASDDGARAAANWFIVSCKSLLGIPMFDLTSFAPGGWVVTYDPNDSGSGGGGGSGCDTQLVYDPEQPCTGSGGGGGGSGGDPSGGGGGGGSGCSTEYVIIEISYDGGATWSTWWEGDATVCG